MAYISNEDQNDQDDGTMDQALQPTQPTALNTNPISGGGASIQTDAAPSRPTNQNTGTNFTGVQKYVDANKGAGQKIGQAAQKSFSNQASTTSQAIQNQQTQLKDQLSQANQRVSSANTFGQEAISKANNAVDVNDVNKQKEALDGRMKALGTLSSGGYTNQIEQNRQQLETERQKVQGQQTQYDQYLKDLEAARVTDNPSLEIDAIDKQSGLEGGARIKEDSLSKDLDALNQHNKRIENYNTIKTQGEGYKSSLDQQKGLINTLEQDQEQVDLNQRKYERQQQIQTELSGLQEKLDKGIPLTNEEYVRYNNVSSGREKFDNATFNDDDTGREASRLYDLSKLASSESGRSELLRQTFSKPNSEYSRGQQRLDQLLLQRDPDAAKAFIENVQTQGKNLSDQSLNSRRSALEGLSSLGMSAKNLKDTFNKQTKTSTDELGKTLGDRMKTGEGSYLKKLQDSFNAGLLSKEQAETLASDYDGENRLAVGQSYGLDVAKELGDVSKYATRESVGSKSDLARAKALARLSGQPDQTFFADESRVGSMSEAERMRLNELKDQMYDAKGKSDQERSNLEAARTYATRKDWIQDDPTTKMYMQANTTDIIQGVNKMLETDNRNIEDLSRDEIEDLSQAYYRRGSGHASNGIGNLSMVGAREKELLDQQNKLLQQRMNVEGMDEQNLTRTQEQKNSQLGKKKQDLYDALQSGSGQDFGAYYGGQNKQNIIDRLRAITGKEFAPTWQRQAWATHDGRPISTAKTTTTSEQTVRDLYDKVRNRSNEFSGV